MWTCPQYRMIPSRNIPSAFASPLLFREALSPPPAGEGAGPPARNPLSSEMLRRKALRMSLFVENRSTVFFLRQPVALAIPGKDAGAEGAFFEQYLVGGFNFCIIAQSFERV